MKREKGRTPIHRAHITFIKHAQLLLTGVLLTALLVLLFGVFNQLPPPDITVQTTGATTIDYSTFLAQIRAGNVLTVSFQDQNMEGALARPLSSSQITPSPQTKLTPLIGTPSPNPAQLVSTRLPGSGDAALIPLLESKHVMIKMLPSAHLPQWLLLLWKFLPFLFLLWMLVWVLSPHRHAQAPGPVDDDKHIKQIRYRAAPERQDSQAPETSSDDTSSRNTSAHVRASSPVRPELAPPLSPSPMWRASTKCARRSGNWCNSRVLPNASSTWAHAFRAERCWWVLLGRAKPCSPKPWPAKQEYLSSV